MTGLVFLFYGCNNKAKLQQRANEVEKRLNKDYEEVEAFNKLAEKELKEAMSDLEVSPETEEGLVLEENLNPLQLSTEEKISLQENIEAKEIPSGEEDIE
jgi:hypothetical protein